MKMHPERINNNGSVEIKKLPEDERTIIIAGNNSITFPKNHKATFIFFETVYSFFKNKKSITIQEVIEELKKGGKLRNILTQIGFIIVIKEQK